MRKYVCKGGQGCVKPKCEFTAKGKPWDEGEALYMCQYNHWRSRMWVQVRKGRDMAIRSVKPNAGGEGRELCERTSPPPCSPGGPSC